MERKIYSMEWHFCQINQSQFPGKTSKLSKLFVLISELRNSHSCMNTAIEFQIYRAIENSISRSLVHFSWPHFTTANEKNIVHKMPKKRNVERKWAAWVMHKLKMARKSRRKMKKRKRNEELNGMVKAVTHNFEIFAFCAENANSLYSKTHFTVQHRKHRFVFHRRRNYSWHWLIHKTKQMFDALTMDDFIHFISLSAIRYERRKRQHLLQLNQINEIGQKRRRRINMSSFDNHDSFQ